MLRGIKYTICFMDQRRYDVWISHFTLTKGWFYLLRNSGVVAKPTQSNGEPPLSATFASDFFSFAILIISLSALRLSRDLLMHNAWHNGLDSWRSPLTFAVVDIASVEVKWTSVQFTWYRFAASVVATSLQGESETRDFIGISLGNRIFGSFTYNAILVD